MRANGPSPGSAGLAWPRSSLPTSTHKNRYRRCRARHHERRRRLPPPSRASWKTPSVRPTPAHTSRAVLVQRYGEGGRGSHYRFSARSGAWPDGDARGGRAFSPRSTATPALRVAPVDLETARRDDERGCRAGGSTWLSWQTARVISRPLARALVALFAAGRANSTIAAAEINPLLVMEGGAGVRGARCRRDQGGVCIGRLTICGFGALKVL